MTLTNQIETVDMQPSPNGHVGMASCTTRYDHTAAGAKSFGEFIRGAWWRAWPVADWSMMVVGVPSSARPYIFYRLSSIPSLLRQKS